MCHSAFGFRLREIPPSRPAQTLVISDQAASRVSNSDPCLDAPEKRPWLIRKKYSDIFGPTFLGSPHSLSIFGKLERKSLPTPKSAGPYHYGITQRHSPLSAIELK